MTIKLRICWQIVFQMRVIRTYVFFKNEKYFGVKKIVSTTSTLPGSTSNFLRVEAEFLHPASCLRLKGINTGDGAIENEYLFGLL